MNLLKLINWFLVAIQVIAGCILMSLGFSGEDYRALSTEITGSSHPSFASSLLEYVLTTGFGIFSTALTILFVVKEFLIGPLKSRVQLNLLVLALVVLLLGLIFPALYHPV